MSISPEESIRRLCAELDEVKVPERPWSAVRESITKRRRRHWVQAATVSSAALAVFVIVGTLTVVLHGHGAGQVAASGNAGVPAAVHKNTPKSPVINKAIVAKAAKPGFIAYVAGRNLDGAAMSASSIAYGSTLNPARSNDNVLVTAPAGQAEWSPSVNPAHTRLVYAEDPPAHIEAFGGEGNLMISNIDGSAPQKVTSGNSDADPVWSPNGSQIAFLRDSTIWLMSANGSHQHSLGIGLASVHSLSWAPNGKELAVGDGESPERIAIVNISGPSFRWFTPANGVEQYQPSWSPDGTELVYGQTGPNALFVSNIDGTGKRQLTTCNTSSCTQDVEPAWSPDGSQIAFVRSDYGVQQIYVIPAAGGHVQAITTGPDQYTLPSW
jgi:dipeptidyl aminopeptidase/acylaminoacyl peptidase